MFEYSSIYLYNYTCVRNVPGKAINLNLELFPRLNALFQITFKTCVSPHAAYCGVYYLFWIFSHSTVSCENL